MKNKHDVHGKHYDEVIVTYDYLLHAIVKAEVLREDQFEMLLTRIMTDSGMNEDEAQLTQTYLRAIRSQAIN